MGALQAGLRVLSRSPMAEPRQQRTGAGCLSKLLFLVLLAAALGLGSAIFQALQPQDLTDLGGYGPTAKALPVREVKVVLKNAIDRGYPVTLSEAEINQWLARTLVTRQAGFLEGKVTLDRVWVRLQDGLAEVVMERHFLGKPFTVSMFLQIERVEGMDGVATEIELHGGAYHPDFPQPPQGGRFGKLIVPQGFLILVMPAYQKLAALFPEEIELAFREMSQIKIENNQIVLDPRTTSGSDGLPQTF
jgi:hypothetical protein